MKHTRNKYHYAIRKCKRAAENIKRDKLLEGCTNGNIFDAIHKMRNVKKDDLPSIIDDSDKPVQRFAEVYGELYNNVDDSGNCNEMLSIFNASISPNSVKDVNLVTQDLIETVVHNIKPNKKDPIFTFTSNCVKNAPSALYIHIAIILRSFLTHGHISSIILTSIIMPLIKDKLGDNQNSDNYRSIALSSIILKILDWVFLTLFKDQLKLDELQFAYQKNCSTTMCTWLVVETIGHFRRNGSEVFSCFMDMKKAFDMVQHSLLFEKLAKRNIPYIYLRLLLVMYRSQNARVKWGESLSDAFEILNGVKQGAVLSAVLFCIYVDDLIKKLRRKREGCWVNDEFVGMIVYADDIALLAPSLDGLQNMINDCAAYAQSHNLKFSTNINLAKCKTKCIAFTQRKVKLNNLMLDGKELPWVNSLKHLGTTVTNNGPKIISNDITEKRAQYIAKNNELNQEFHYAHPNTKIWINNTYNTSFYGAPLWDMFSKNMTKLEKTWNVSVRIMLSLPRNTHRYLIEPLSKVKHIVRSLRKRFITFIEKIKAGEKAVLKKMLDTIESDARSTTGRNLRCLKLQGLDNIGTSYEISENEVWRIKLAEDIISARTGRLSTILSDEELEQICIFVCSS